MQHRPLSDTQQPMGFNMNIAKLQLEGLLHQTLNHRGRSKLTKAFCSHLRYNMPYLIEPLGDDLFLPLNREYKPLGMMPVGWVDYKACRGLGVEASSGMRMYFFNDGCPPWDSKDELTDYLERVTKELMLD